MSNAQALPAARQAKLRPWQIIVVFGLLQGCLYGAGSFTFDYFAGGATAGPGIWPEVGGMGMFFIYALSFYIALMVVLPILLIRRFGVGTAIYLPYAILGLVIEYYMEMVRETSLKSYGAVIGWCAFGLLVGLSADLAYRLLPATLSERRRAILTGLVMGLTNFLLVNVALTFFYAQPQAGPGSFLGIAYYGLPFLLLNSGFAGYTAHAIARRA